MPRIMRSELEQEIVNAFIDSQAVNFEAVGSIISKYGARAARSGVDLVTIINKNIMINCGWPGPEIGRVANQRFLDSAE